MRKDCTLGGAAWGRARPAGDTGVWARRPLAAAAVSTLTAWDPRGGRCHGSMGVQHASPQEAPLWCADSFELKVTLAAGSRETCVPPPDYQEELEGDDKRSPEAPSLTHPRGKADYSLLSAGSSLVPRGPPQPQAPHCILHAGRPVRPAPPASEPLLRARPDSHACGVPIHTYIPMYLCTYVPM